MGRRIGAYAIDLLIGWVVLAAIMVPLVMSKVDSRDLPSDNAANDYCQPINDETFGTYGEDDPTADQPDPSFDRDSAFCVSIGSTAYVVTGGDLLSWYLWFIGASYASTLLNTILLQGLTGASIGKFLTRLRVVREDGQRAGFGWNLLRSVLLVVDGAFFIGLIVALTQRGHRRIGDMAASTYVVARGDVGRPVELPQPHAPAPMAPGWRPPPPVAPAGPPTNDGPHWEPVRGAYIQYDRSSSTWLQWDDHDQVWKPIQQ